VENYIPKEAEGQLTDDVLKKICIEAIKDSERKKNEPEPAKRSAKVSNSISTNSGMYHIHLACHGAGGSFDLKLGSKNGRNTVILEVSLPARQDVVRCAENQGAAGQTGSCIAPTSAHLATSQDSIPEGLKICVIDDSKVFCRIEVHDGIPHLSFLGFPVYDLPVFIRSSAKATRGLCYQN
jgi:hypothetical protein